MRETLIYGIGVNDSQYKTQVFKKVNDKWTHIWTCPFYQRWKDMLKRCYSKSFIQKHPTYINCTVCDEWLVFSNFRKWMLAQNWRRKELDKDLLVYKNKVYSPDTCVFIPHEINSFMCKSNSARGKYPIGVAWQVKSSTMHNERLSPFRAQITMGGSKNRTLGYSDTALGAHRIWQIAKISQAKVLAYKQSNNLIKDGLLRIAQKIQADYDYEIETTDF